MVILVGAVYWPVHAGGFVWDDALCFRDAAWLRHGDDWTHYVFRGFCDWTDYFRPLVVSLYVLQVRLFDSAPGPMHLVSLGLHLLNTVLVGLLALKLRQAKPAGTAAVAFCMLLYGLHPALIEPVFWIGCQYELVTTMCMLLGLALNEMVESRPLRAVAVAGSFFLAACAKESAITFPILLAIFDFAAHGTARIRGPLYALRAQIERQWLVYLAVLVAGLLYLALRHAAMGPLSVAHEQEPFWSLARLHKVGLTYLTYWKLLLWPMTGMGPIHPVDEARFINAGWQGFAVDAAAAAIAVSGLIALYRLPPLGRIMVAVTAALFPVLHIVPITFNESLYHERYAMTALAVACASIPALLSAVALRPALALGSVALTCAWLLLAVANIRVTLPLWSDELVLWQWAARENPDSVVAQQHLLAKYVERGDQKRARALADALVAKDAQCPVCMLEVAYLGLREGDARLAAIALEKIRDAKQLPNDPLFMEEFVMATGELLELEHDPINAESAYREAMRIDPLDPRPQLDLAYLQLRQGDREQARRTAEAALPLFAPEERVSRRRAFEQAETAEPRP